MRRADLQVGEAYYYKPSERRGAKAIVVSLDKFGENRYWRARDPLTFTLPDGRTTDSQSIHRSSLPEGSKVAVAFEKPNGTLGPARLVPLMHLREPYEQGYQREMQLERERRAREESRRAARMEQQDRREALTERLTEAIGPGHKVGIYSGTVDEATVVALLDALDEARR